MKNIFLILAICLPLCVACSLDEVLKSSDSVSIALMETVDTVKTIPGDTVSFKFIASTNFGYLQRVEIVNKSYDFQDLRDSIRFALVDQTLDLSIDAEGYLSRPVTTVMMIYPVIVPANKEIVGNVISMTFQVSNNEGKSGTVTSCFKVINHIINNSWKSFYNPYGDTKGSAFFNPDKHKVYSAKTYGKNLGVIDIVAYTDVSGKHYCLNPGNINTENLMIEDGFTYSAAAMRKTKFIKLDQMDFSKIGDAELEKMDFSGSIDKIEIGAGSLIGFINQEGRKGILNVKIQSDYPMIQCKFQAVGK